MGTPKIYNFDKFREGQKKIIDKLLAFKDCIALLPTSGGKSVIFVVSAILISGITVVVQPLKFLMEEQAKRLRGNGIMAFYVNSFMEDDQIYEVVNSIGKQTTKYALVFTSPEWLKSKTFEQLLSLLKVQKRLGILNSSG